MVAALCRALLHDRAQADDATQQVFLSAHRALLNGSAPREPAAWLATIARNECRSRALLRAREPLSVDGVERASPLPDPLEEAIRRTDLTALWRAIRELPKPQREAILLREFGGLSYDELAAALSLSGGAVESLLFRARRRLRQTFATLGGESWLQPLLRALVGGSAPLAAKAAALGLGAAALSGGAVLIPRTLAPSRPQHPTPLARRLSRPTPHAPAHETRSDHPFLVTTVAVSETPKRSPSHIEFKDSGAAAADTRERTPETLDSPIEHRISEDAPASITSNPSETTAATSDSNSIGDSSDPASSLGAPAGPSDQSPSDNSAPTTTTPNTDGHTGSDRSD